MMGERKPTPFFNGLGRLVLFLGCTMTVAMAVSIWILDLALWLVPVFGSFAPWFAVGLVVVVMVLYCILAVRYLVAPGIKDIRCAFQEAHDWIELLVRISRAPLLASRDLDTETLVTAYEMQDVGYLSSEMIRLSSSIEGQDYVRKFSITPRGLQRIKDAVGSTKKQEEH